ncbi:MAG: D-aminoacyl-tRNA deacylase [Oscillospiraceae bacterium]
MKAVLQRVLVARVEVDEKTVGKIQHGVVALVGIGQNDTEKELEFMAEKISTLRIFEDNNFKMNKSLIDVGGGLLIVPNFTLYSDLSHGRRPYFSGGASYENATELFEKFVGFAKNTPIKSVESGIFGSDMKLSLLNDGPVTIIIDTDEIMKVKEA